MDGVAGGSQIEQDEDEPGEGQWLLSVRQVLSLVLSLD